VLLAGFVALTLTLAGGGLLGADLAVAHWVDAHRPPALGRLAAAGNYLGQGGILTALAGLVGVGLAVWRRSWRPLALVVTAFVLNFATLTVLKDLTERPAPHSPVPHPERFGVGGNEYPSGHLVNAIVWYGVLALLLAPWLSTVERRVLRVVPPAVLSVTTVYLGFHWLTDTIAGILLGLLLDRLIRRIPWGLPP
jgi:membrane-associated phospholipid phosphatase